MNLRPLFDRVVLQDIDRTSQTKSGIFIPTDVGDEPKYAKVLAIGDGDCFDGNKSQMAVSVGDKVLYNKYGATPFKIDGKEYIILRQSDILGVFEGEE
jgi:chaperonin GroES